MTDQAPVQSAPSVDDRIAAAANSFMDALDEPAIQPGPQEAPAEEVETPQEPEAPAEAEPEAETPQPELAEIEYEGKQYKVAPELRSAFLRHADYTQKTQEAAASRKSAEQMTLAAQNAIAQAQQLAPYFAQLHSMQAQAQAIRQSLTPQLRDNDPIGYNTALSEYNMLTNSIQQSSGQLEQVTQQHRAQLHAVRQAAWNEQAPALIKEFPELAKPEAVRALQEYVVNSGLPQEAIDFINYSAPAAKVFWKAQQYEKLVAEQAKAKASLKSKTQGVPPVKPTGRAPDKEAQIKKLQGDWKKSGGKMTDQNLDQLLRARGIGG